MEVKRICQWCGKPFIAKKTTTNYCSHQCASQGYKHRMKERRIELRELQELIEVKSKLDHQDYFTFAQAAQLMGVSRQYIYKLVKDLPYPDNYVVYKRPLDTHHIVLTTKSFQ